ncbi:MAG: carbohydrate kinase, partial [Rhizobiaceae bacterium]|nr:carbohydrate kinase [Rhizobiaceae bacterium]
NPGSVTETVGGAIFNAAAALGAFGASVRLVSCRGGDADGALVADALSHAGIEDLSVTWLDRRTASYTAILDDRGELVAGIADMAIYDLLSPRVLSRRHLRDALEGADAVLVDANLPGPTVDHLVAAAGQRIVAAIGVSPAKATRLARALPRLSVVFLSRAEAASIVEASSATGIAVIARLLAEAGAQRAVVTDGPSEVAILDADGSVLLQSPPPVARLRDVTGAGDTLAGVATVALIGGATLLDAARLGMAAASRRIGADGVSGPDGVASIRVVAAEMAPPRPIGDSASG